MSVWSYIHGTIEVSPSGRTQAEKTYILQTTLDHLPRVIGSEGDMNIYVNKENGYNYSSSDDEFGCRTNNLIDPYGEYGETKSNHGFLELQRHYLITVDAGLRDVEFEEAVKSFMNWLCRLSKRILVNEICVKIHDYSTYNKVIIIDPKPYYNMSENPTWAKEKNEDTKPAWFEYLMWDRAKHSSLPIMLRYKYYNDEENDKEAEHRINYLKKGE